MSENSSKAAAADSTASASASAAGDAAAKGAAGAGAKAGAAAKPPAYAHFFRLIGMPNFRFKLPSRNWSIFFTIVGSWTAAYAYDRREKKRILQKWQDRVSHLALQPLRPEEMPRSVRIILGAPPADGLLTAREHFHEYVKPILTAGGMDWEAVEGRKEGDVRAMIAEKIREVRIRAGETGEIPERDEGEEKKDMVREIRERSGVDVEGGKATPAGDIVIGRNIWKEYMRGLHEGWLGPLSPPIVPVEEVAAETNPDTPTEATAQRDDPQQLDTPHSEPEQSIVETLTDIVEPANTSESTPFVEDSTGTSQSDSDKVSEEKKKSEEEEEAKKKAEKAKRKQPPPFMSTVEYADAALPPTIPRALGPAIAVPLPHILGFLNTPIRMYRFLKQRELAEDIGRQVVSAVLGAHEPYQQITVQQDQGQGDDLKWEQEESLKNEESEWHKSTRKKAWENKEAGKESLWVDDMVVDSRIVGRMRKFVLPDSTQEQGTSEEMS